MWTVKLLCFRLITQKLDLFSLDLFRSKFELNLNLWENKARVLLEFSHMNLPSDKYKTWDLFHVARQLAVCKE